MNIVSFKVTTIIYYKIIFF